MTNVYFHPEVARDIRESVVWYESQAKGLGGDFINELESAYEAIAELPGVWPQFGKGFRRYILTRFPFAVIYRQSKEKIYVIAVMHQSRKPNYWLNRIVE